MLYLIEVPEMRCWWMLLLFLLWSDIPNMKFTLLTIFRWSFQWHEVHSQHCPTITTIHFWNFFISVPIKQ